MDLFYFSLFHLYEITDVVVAAQAVDQSRDFLGVVSWDKSSSRRSEIIEDPYGDNEELVRVTGVYGGSGDLPVVE